METESSTFTQSIIKNVEKFLSDLDRNNTTIMDEIMVASFRNMGRTLQRILSKHDKTDKVKSAPKEDESQEITLNQSQPAEPKSSSAERKPSRLFDESFLYSGPDTTSDDDVEERIRKRCKKDIENSDDELRCGKTFLEDVPSTSKRELIDPNLEKIDDDNYRCKTCDKKMNKNNVQSHLSGKSHRNKSRESSCSDRKSSVVDEDNIEKILRSIQRNLKYNKAGDPYITVRNNTASPLQKLYYCNICKVDIAWFDVNVQQHVNGSQHKRLCEAVF